MPLVVMKFGGSSVADPEKIQNVVRRVKEKREAGNGIVVVVSAMGDTTDEMIALAQKLNPDPSEREMDQLISSGERISAALLAMALQNAGLKATSLTGEQMGIITDDSHTKARILQIRPDKIKTELAESAVVVAAGFQGTNLKKDVTTLGRGGSDTTAVALAAALDADFCEIYTDVDGVYTSDPRVVPAARKLGRISYDEMLEMASLGARVMQSRAVEFAKKFSVVLHVRSSFKESQGTIISEETDDMAMEKVVIRGVTLTEDEAKLTISGVPDRPGIAATIFKAIAERNVNVDMIIQNVSEEGFTDVSFTVPRAELNKARQTLDALLPQIKAKGVKADESIAKASIVGVGMKSHPGIAATMFDALSREEINIMMISTSEIKISCVVEKQVGEKAARALHSAFGLDQEKD